MGFKETIRRIDASSNLRNISSLSGKLILLDLLLN